MCIIIVPTESTLNIHAVVYMMKILNVLIDANLGFVNCNIHHLHSTMIVNMGVVPDPCQLEHRIKSPSTIT